MWGCRGGAPEGGGGAGCALVRRAGSPSGHPPPVLRDLFIYSFHCWCLVVCVYSAQISVYLRYRNGGPGAVRTCSVERHDGGAETERGERTGEHAVLRQRGEQRPCGGDTREQEQGRVVAEERSVWAGRRWCGTTVRGGGMRA